MVIKQRTRVSCFAFLIVVFLFFTAQALWSEPITEDPASFIGLTLTELFGRFGPPIAVYSTRGIEEWQDDVVFVYDQGDFYILNDRVWQINLKMAMGIKTGDNAAVVSLVLGSRVRLAESSENSVSYFIDGKSWPMLLRCDFNKEGRVQMIFIYRSDL